MTFFQEQTETRKYWSTEHSVPRVDHPPSPGKKCMYMDQLGSKRDAGRAGSVGARLKVVYEIGRAVSMCAEKRLSFT